MISFKLIRQSILIVSILAGLNSNAQQDDHSALSKVSPEILSAEQQLRDTISLWAGAWAAQIPSAHFEFYAERYVAPGFANRQTWLEDRRKRIDTPDFIRIRLLDFELVETSEILAGELLALTRFTLIYERPGYSDITSKELELINRGDAWKITRETNVRVEVLESTD